MKTELRLRKQAVRLWLAGCSKAEIARRLWKPRLWVQRWLSRYDPQAPEASLQNRSSAPHHLQERYPQSVKKAVLRSRKERAAKKLSQYQHALLGADAIYYELQALGVRPLPAPRTIHTWLKQAGQVQARTGKTKKPPNLTYPKFRCQAVNDLHQLDLKGPFYLQDSSQKHYLATLRDVYGKRVAVKALTNKKMATLLDFLIESWGKYGCPRRLQMDNGLEFRGSNRYPRSLSKL